jgi:hypothetical protein
VSPLVVSCASFALALALAVPALAQEPTPPAPDAPGPPETPATTGETPPAPGEPPPADTPPAQPEIPTESDPPATPPPVNLPTDIAPPAAVDVGPACGRAAAVCVKNEYVAMWPRLRLRAGYEFVQADPEVLYVGGNDGFFLDQARVGADANVKDLAHLRITFDGASLLPGSAPNQPVTPLVDAVRDAYVAWTPGWYLNVIVGQQVMPSDLEGGDIDQTLPFTRRSVVSSGVRAGHGYAVQGLSPSRQLGVVVGNGDGASIGPALIEYKLGISNGNGQNIHGNDNKLPAAYLRLGAGYEDVVKVGVGGRFNPRTVGTLPNLYTETDAVGFADVMAHVLGFELVLVGIARQTSFTTLVPDPTDPAGQETALGAVAWISVQEPFGFSLFGFAPGYRISYYDPSSAFLTDQLLENTIGVRWNVPVEALPLSVFLDFTILTELGDGARDLSNNRVTALFQLDL